LYALQFISPFTSGLSVGQTLVIAVSFPSIRYVLTQSLNFPRAFVVVGYKVKDVTDVHGAAEPIDFHEPDWHRDIAFLIQYSYLPRIYRGRQICFEK
ncbi:TPA: hypothetical protein ACH9NN_005653, partial [Escherichia coli]